MVQLRYYDPQTGAIQVSITATVANGALDYLGAGQFISTNIDTVEQFEVRSDGTMALQRTLLTLGASENGAGVAVQRSHAADGDGWSEPDGPKVFIGLEELVAGVATYGLRVYELTSGGLDADAPLAPIPGVWGGLATDGRQIIAALTDTIPNIVVLYVDAAGSQSPTSRTISSLTTMPRDITFDGRSLWTIEGTNANQYGFGPTVGMPLIKSFALTGANPSGICFDGQSLVVLSRT